MSLPGKIIAFITLTVLLTLNGISFCQSTYPAPGKYIGTVIFKHGGAKLTKKAKAVLDMLVGQMRVDSSVQIVGTLSNKDLCTTCGARSWDRTQTLITYFFNCGIPEQRLSIVNRLDGESNKVNLFLMRSVGENREGNSKEPLVMDSLQNSLYNKPK